MIEKEKICMKKVLIRGIFGIICIICVNEYLAYKGIDLCVGLNEITFLTTGILGIPGTALLYGITALKFL